MESVLALTRAVLVHLEALTVIDLALHRDVVALFALGAFQGHFDPLIILGSLSYSSPGRRVVTAQRSARVNRADRCRQKLLT